MTRLLNTATFNAGSSLGIDIYTGTFTYANDIGLENTSGGLGIGLTKAGAGTLALTSAANTYTGNTLVDAGSLLVSGSFISTSGTLTVAGGATLGMKGSTTGGTSLSTLNVGTLVLTLGGGSANGSTLSFAIGYSGSTDSITAAMLSLENSGTVYIAANASGTSGGPSGTYSLLLWSNTSVGNISQFALTGGLSGDGTLQIVQIGSESVLQFVAVPEPLTWLMLLGGLGVMLVWRNVRSQRLCMLGATANPDTSAHAFYRWGEPCKRS